VNEYRSVHLQEGNNDFGNETITLQKMQFCLSVTSKPNGPYQHETEQIRYIKIALPNEYNMLSMTLHVHFTSEEKSFAVDNNFTRFEGDEYEMKLRMRQLPGGNKEELLGFVQLDTTITKYIKEKAGCREESLWKLIEPSFVTSVKKNCGANACLPNGFPFTNINLRTCANFSEYDCPTNQLKNVLKTNKNANVIPCTKLEYSGNHQIYPIDAFLQIVPEILQDNYEPGKQHYLVQYTFKQPETTTLNEEYYVVQTLDLIGVVGGTLGLFVEFTFYGLLSFLLNLIQSFTDRNGKCKLNNK